jgi:hypothetical protein
MFLRTFLKDNRYGKRGVMEESVSLRVDSSERVVRRRCTEEECDLRRAVKVLNFFESVETRTFPAALSLTGR